MKLLSLLFFGKSNFNIMEIMNTIKGNEKSILSYENVWKNTRKIILLVNHRIR